MRPPPEALASLLAFVTAIEQVLDANGVTAAAAAGMPGTFLGHLRLAILPGIRARLAGEAELPAESSLGAMAMRELDGDERMQPIVAMLSQFDASYRTMLDVYGKLGS